MRYGMAELDRFTGIVSWNINLPMEKVVSGNIHEFFESAGEEGWELCAAFPSGVKGASRPLLDSQKLRVAEDPSEQITFMFKKD